MARRRLKWKFVIISCLILLNVFTKSLPVYDSKVTGITTTDTTFKQPEVPLINEDPTTKDSDIKLVENKTDLNDEVLELPVKLKRNSLLSNVRPGQEVEIYTISLTPQGNTFTGRAVIEVSVTADTRENDIRFNIGTLRIHAVRAALFSTATPNNVDYTIANKILRVSPGLNALSYVLEIDFTGQMRVGGRGFFHGGFFDNSSYLAMNLHPTYARHVFPSMDEPTEHASIKFTYNDIEFNTILSNSHLEEGSTNEFVAIAGPAHGWGMVAHNFININLPTANVLLHARAGLQTQDSQASVAINSFFNNLQEWTDRDFFSIHLNQDGRLNIVALPDVSTSWHSLSVIGIWEPYLMMELNHAIKQRKTALYEIANAMAKQWFGFVIHPENWRYEWVVSGLASYAAYEVMRTFQTNDLVEDVTLLDVNTLFVTDVIQESLLRDAYVGTQPLEPSEDIFNEHAIRDHVNGILKVKAPALLRMMRLMLGDPDEDFIQSAARTLLNRRSLDTVNSLRFRDAINSDWLADGNGMIEDVGGFLNDWKDISGYPLIHASLRQGGVQVTQEHFSFGPQVVRNFPIPITFTTSIVQDFENIQPIMVLDGSFTFTMNLGPEDWVLFNIQGQGYYRVNYDDVLWERIIETLDDPDTREEIHPLNRATLVDDSLNIARAGKLLYDFAFEVVLTMEHEIEYAVWKAFIRNMEFLRKRLLPYVAEHELDPDIYLRMVRRTIHAVEEELGFEPELNLIEPAMHTLTRGLVMEHACKANYDPCVAAAVEWFWAPNNDEIVNPGIPHELRPAVYCTMVREGDEEVIEALEERLNLEATLYERLVILESWACSQDEDFILSFLEDTIADESPYTVEERNKIFIAVVESSYENAGIALAFMAANSGRIIEMYGGLEKFETLILVLADNMADNNLAQQFQVWRNSQNNNLGESENVAQRAGFIIIQNLAWSDANLEYVYEWIDENDASTTILSFAALCISMMITLLNH